MKVGWCFSGLWKESGVSLGTKLSWKNFGWSPWSADMIARLFLLILNIARWWLKQTHYQWHCCSCSCCAGCNICKCGVSPPGEWDTTVIIFCRSVIATFTNVYTHQVLFSWFIIIYLEFCLSKWSYRSVSS